MGRRVKEGDLVAWEPTGEPSLWRVRRIEFPRLEEHTRVCLSYVSGWAGYEGHGYPVKVKPEDVRALSPLEMLGRVAE